MADMTDLIRRLSLTLLLFLLIVGAVGHLFLSVNNAPHAAKEANCAIHSGIVHPEKTHLVTHKPAITIGETKDGARDLSISTKISHPPTF